MTHQESTIAPGTEPWVQKWEARERELRQQATGSGRPHELVEVFVETMLRKEIAVETGTDEAAIRAEGLIRKYGLRQAQKLVRDPAYQRSIESVGGGDAIEENRRIGQYLAAYRAGWPWWRRILAG
jgi:hypothetical protein